jgi:CDGSH-type Zn-finger protein
MTKEKPKPPFFPIVCNVEAGKTYLWCGCRESKTEPFCDKANCSQAVAYKATLTETLYFCGCKETKDPPLCDGSHARLLWEYMKKT